MKKTGIVQVKVLKNREILSDQCLVADRFFARLQGLIGKKSFPPGEGLLFPHCNDVHMWFMSMPIDICFLKGPYAPGKDSIWEVSRVVSRANAWSLLPFRERKAEHTLELPSGVLESLKIQKGDQLCINWL